ncbi:chondroitin sulfate synthase 3 isoform X3 [Anolis carolinensis]|uniref:chondroitin sulfate synthase 3 isoform X3 n=1 Tax=Anolis carolinensis TaxID=28377 RepID=UPI002F2B7147
MAARSRHPWLSVALGLVLGFTVASWLIAPKVAELSERKRRGGAGASPGALSSSSRRSDGGHSPCAFDARVAGEPRQLLPPEEDAVEGTRSVLWETDRQPPQQQQQQPEQQPPPPPPPLAEDSPGEGREEEEEARRGGSSSSSVHNGSGDFGAPPGGCAEAPRPFLYVGVMTAQKYLSGRALAARRTWARSIPGRVEFFSSQGSAPPPVAPGEPPLPVVALPGVDDAYPPQKKSFMMLKYMHDRYLDTYEWFMRADDDVYIKGEKLEEFLRSLNSSKPLYLGQTGLGNTEELGKLGLEPGENFCMGGPGMIFSREVLRRMVPHIGECLREMYTTHEDVEVGRCVRRFGGTQCVWSYETLSLMPLKKKKVMPVIA